MRWDGGGGFSRGPLDEPDKSEVLAEEAEGARAGIMNNDDGERTLGPCHSRLT